MKRITRFACPLLLSAALPAFATTLELRVTTFADEDDGLCSPEHCSLREAVSAGNQAGEATIRLAAGEYALGHANARDNEGRIIDEDDNLSGDLDVHGSLTISGRGYQATLVNGAELDRVLQVHPGARLSLRALSLTGGRTPYRGAGLANHGDAELLEVQVAGNATTDNALLGQGGGIHNSGRLLIKRSLIGPNRATGSTSENGRGGGIHNSGELYLRDSGVSGNQCTDPQGSGEGCGVFSSGSAEIARSYLISNRSAAGSGAAILNHGRLLLSNTTISDNSGYGPTSAALHTGGVGLDNHSIEAKLVHVTIAGNQAVGMIIEARVILLNSILTGNAQAGEPANCRTTPSLVSYRSTGLMISPTSGGSCPGDIYAPDSSIFINHLEPLSLEGEGLRRTAVHRLRPTSFAIDAGYAACASYDQRAASRPRDGNGDGLARCDLGAYEY